MPFRIRTRSSTDTTIGSVLIEKEVSVENSVSMLDVANCDVGGEKVLVECSKVISEKVLVEVYEDVESSTTPEISGVLETFGTDTLGTSF